MNCDRDISISDGRMVKAAADAGLEGRCGHRVVELAQTRPMQDVMTWDMVRNTLPHMNRFVTPQACLTYVINEFTDTLVACSITQAITNAYPVRSLPPVTVSCSHEHRAWPGTVSISDPTLYSVISDIRQSLRQYGITRLVVVNGHGGNYMLRNVVQEASVEGPLMALYPTSSAVEGSQLTLDGQPGRGHVQPGGPAPVCCRNFALPVA